MLDAIISSSFEAIVAIDTKKKIVMVNQQAEILLGYPETELIGNSVEELYIDKVKAREIYDAIQDEGKVGPTELLLAHKNGGQISIMLSGKKIVDETGNILGQVGYMRDIREIRSLEVRLNELIETSKTVNSTHKLDEILEYVIRSVLRAIPAADRGSIHFYEEQSRKLILKVSSYDYSRKTWGLLGFEVGVGLAGWVFYQQQPVISMNTIDDTRFKPADNPEVKPHLSMLCVPITSKSRQIGVMNLSNSIQTNAFSSDDLDLLTGYADHAAIAIETAEQISRMEKETEELKILRNASLNFNKLFGIKDILTTILETGNNLLGTEMAVIHWRGRSGEKIQTFVAPEELLELATEPRSQEGLTTEIFRSGEQVIIPDVTQDGRVNSTVVKAGIQSLAGFPLHLGGREAGVLFYNSRQQQFFGERESRLLSLLLPAAAVAIENADTIERLERTLKLTESLVEVSCKLAATLLIEEQMVALKHFMQEELAAPIFFLGLYDELNNRIYFKIDYEDGADLELSSIPMKNEDSWTISSYVVKERKPIIWYDDAKKQSECARLGIKPLPTITNCQTCLAFPLEVEGESLGVISIQSQEPFAWDEIEVHTFQTLAHQASIAIRNVKLHQQLNQTHETVMTVAQTVAQMTAQGNLKNTLDSIAKGVKEVLGCDIVTLYTYQQDNERFALPPTTAGEIRFPDKLVGPLKYGTAPYKFILMDDIYISEDSRTDPMLGQFFTIREDISSTVAAPLRVPDKRVGILFINYCHEKHIFTTDEISNIHMFSHQAAIAISNAMLYDDEQKHKDVLKIIDEAGRVVTSSMQLDEVFDNLARQAYKLTGEKGEIANFATINLVEGNQTVLKAVFPPSEEENIIEANLVTTDLNMGVNGRIGIIGRAVKIWASVLVKDVTEHPDYLSSHPDTKCELAVPIIYRDEVVGVINVEHKMIGGLDDEDRQNIESLAAHAAVGIQTARIYQAFQRKSRHQHAIYKASKIINAGFGRTEKELLNLLVEHMVTEIVPAASARNNMGSILLYNHEKNELKVECNYSEGEGSHLKDVVRSLSHPQQGRIGISGRAVITKKPQRVDDVRTDIDYLNNNDKTKSELDVPMLEGDTVLGVLSLQCNQLSGFDQDAEDAMCSFAELASIAIQNTRRYQELKETRATVGNITAVAWMGLVAGAWRHTIGNMATTISDISELTKNDLIKGASNQNINLRLNKIQEIVDDIQKIPMPPLSSEQGVEPINILQLVHDRINQYKGKKEHYGDIEFDMVFEIYELTKVRASPEWLRRILDIVIDNARNSMKGKKRKQIKTLIIPKDKGVEILISDTGAGIPVHLIPILGKNPISKKGDEKGSGIGLFLVSSIIQVYGGRLKIHSTDPDGTTISLWFPIFS